MLVLPCHWLDGCQLTAVVCFRVEKEVGGMEMAHEGMIWSLAWHPLGHILCSGSNDHTRYAHTHTPAHTSTVLHNILMSDEQRSTRDSSNVFSKFWTRNRPGDKMRDRYNLNLLPGMSEDGVEYGEPQEDRHQHCAITFTFTCVSTCVCV